MEINEFEAGMLDAVLEAFGGTDELNKEQILELFGGDEPLAAAVVDLLIATGMATPAGATAADGLPTLLMRDAQAENFLQNGGFTAQIHSNKVESAKKDGDAGVNWQTAPTTPSAFNEEAPEAYPVTALPPVADEVRPEDITKDIQPDPTESASPTVPKRYPEIIFEVTVADGDEPTLTEEPTEQPPAPETNDIIDEQADNVTEDDITPAPFTPFTKEISNSLLGALAEPEEQLPVTEQAELVASPVDNVLPPDTIAIEGLTEPVITPLNHELETLQRQIFQLERGKILSDQQLIEKSQQISSLESQNAQLRSLRLFIWLLLAIILFQVIWTVTH